MRINEVETQVGITKKNIRFYEEQGLLHPRRSAENGYRDYGEGELVALRRIKLLRKLGVPLEEIRNMQAGSMTLQDCMRRHLVSLEREQHSVEQSMVLCRRLKDEGGTLETLDAQRLLEEMENMESAGTTFLNRQVGDTGRLRYVAPAVIAVLTVLLMSGVIGLLLWAFTVDPQEAPPPVLLAALIIMPALVILGVLLALVQRIREIQKGEAEHAKQY